MKIAIDASRAVEGQRAAGYFRDFLKALANVGRDDHFVLFTPQPLNFPLPANFAVVVGGPKRLWTHLYLGKVAQECGADVLFVYHHVLPYNLKIPGVVTIHDVASLIFPEHYSKREKFYQDFGNRLAISKAAKIIAVSETTRQDFLELYDVSEKDIIRVYNGFSSNFTKCSSEPVTVRRKYNLNKPFILFVGALEPRKNVTNLVLAFQILKERFKPWPYDLVLAGSLGSSTEEINQLAAAAGLTDSVKMLGRVNRSDLVALYLAAEVFVFPSWYEGFGFPVLEAFACKVPVVASRIPALLEIAQDAALFAEPASPHEIADQIWELIVNQKKRATLVKKGLKRIKDFSWERCALETLEVIKQAV